MLVSDKARNHWLAHKEKWKADWRAHDETFPSYRTKRPFTVEVVCGMCHCAWYEDLGCNVKGQCPECGECFPKYLGEEEEC